MEIIKNINDLLGNFDNIIGVIGTIVGIIGAIVGAIGHKEFKEAKNIKTEISNSTVEHNQTAESIMNTYNGIGVKDAEHIAQKAAEQSVKDIPVIRYGSEPPDNSIGKDGDLYLQIDDK